MVDSRLHSETMAKKPADKSPYGVEYPKPPYTTASCPLQAGSNVAPRVVSGLGSRAVSLKIGAGVSVWGGNRAFLGGFCRVDRLTQHVTVTSKRLSYCWVQ